MDHDHHVTLVLPDGRRFGPTSLVTIAAWAREGRVPVEALIEHAPATGAHPPDGGEPGAIDGVDGASPNATPVWEIPDLRSILAAPPTERSVAVGQAARSAVEPSPIATLIPYRNPPALIGYYLSLLSLLPLVGLPLGVIAIVLGIMGFRRRRADPAIKGAAHATIAVAVGTLGVLITCVAIALIRLLL